MSSSTLGAYKAEHLKKKGDAEVRKENYRDAIKHYSEALEVRSYGFVVAQGRGAEATRRSLFVDGIRPDTQVSLFFVPLCLSVEEGWRRRNSRAA
jgi:hypothetical protein